jgi:uncharacterized protein (TIGR03083 family)
VKTKERNELWRGRYLTAIRVSAERFAEVLETADLSAPVPTCPGWTLAELAGHLGGVHRWARHAVVHGEQGAHPEVEAMDREFLLAWLRQGADDLLEVLEDADPTMHTWHFGPKPRTVGFWMRRQAHETTIHTIDALRAAGEPDLMIDRRLAVDGVAEVCEMFYPRQVKLGRTAELPIKVRFHATDVPEWSVILHGEGPEVAVNAPAAELYLAVWRRGVVEGADPRVAAALGGGIAP